MKNMNRASIYKLLIALLFMSATLSISMEAKQTIRQTLPDNEIFNTYHAYYYYHIDTPDFLYGPSDIYKLKFPKTSIFHPYSLETELRNVENVPLSFNISLFLYLPSDQVKGLPIELDPYIQDVPQNKIDLMVVIQNMPWIQGQPVLYRPHYYLEPKATYLGTYNNAQSISADCIFYCGNPVSFSKNQMVASTHPADGVTVLSGPAPDSIYLEGVNNQQSSLFFTVFKHTDRLAVTLHGLLSDGDHELFRQMVAPNGYVKFGDFMENALYNLKSISIFQSLYDILDW